MYATSQFGLFYLRANSITLFGLKQGQLSALSLLVAIVPVTLLWWNGGGRRGIQPVLTKQEAPDGQPA